MDTRKKFFAYFVILSTVLLIAPLAVSGLAWSMDYSYTNPVNDSGFEQQSSDWQPDIGTYGAFYYSSSVARTGYYSYYVSNSYVAQVRQTLNDISDLKGNTVILSTWYHGYDVASVELHTYDGSWHSQSSNDFTVPDNEYYVEVHGSFSVASDVTSAYIVLNVVYGTSSSTASGWFDDVHISLAESKSYFGPTSTDEYRTSMTTGLGLVDMSSDGSGRAELSLAVTGAVGTEALNYDLNKIDVAFSLDQDSSQASSYVNIEYANTYYEGNSAINQDGVSPTFISVASIATGIALGVATAGVATVAQGALLSLGNGVYWNYVGYITGDHDQTRYDNNDASGNFDYSYTNKDAAGLIFDIHWENLDISQTSRLDITVTFTFQNFEHTITPELSTSIIFQAGTPPDNGGGGGPCSGNFCIV